MIASTFQPVKINLSISIYNHLQVNFQIKRTNKILFAHLQHSTVTFKRSVNNNNKKLSSELSSHHAKYTLLTYLVPPALPYLAYLVWYHCQLALRSWKGTTTLHRLFRGISSLSWPCLPPPASPSGRPADPSQLVFCRPTFLHTYLPSCAALIFSNLTSYSCATDSSPSTHQLQPKATKHNNSNNIPRSPHILKPNPSPSSTTFAIMSAQDKVQHYLGALDREVCRHERHLDSYDHGDRS